MTERNVELQLQALDLIEKKCGIIPESLIPHKMIPHAKEVEKDNANSNPSKIKNAENKIMQDVIE